MVANATSLCTSHIQTSQDIFLTFSKVPIEATLCLFGDNCISKNGDLAQNVTS